MINPDKLKRTEIPIGIRLMSSAMHDVKELVKHLPDDTSIEDVQYHLYVLEKICKERGDISNGRHYSTQEAKDRLSRWLKP